MRVIQFQTMSVEAARQFLLRNNKAGAMANGTWPKIRDAWNEALAVVEVDKNEFRALPPAGTEWKTHSEESKQLNRERQKLVCLKRKRKDR